MKKILKILFVKSLYLINIVIFCPVFLILLPVILLKRIKFYGIDYFLGANVNLKIYFCRKRRDLYKNEVNLFFIQNYFEIFVLKKNISNTFWLSILSENLLPVTPKNIFFFLFYNFFIEKIYNIINLFNLKSLLINLEGYHGYFRGADFDVRNYIEAKDHLVKLKKKDLAKCELEFEKLNELLNIKSNQEIVTFCNRDGAYKKYQLPNMDLSYHDFRNFPIQDYEMCIRNLIEKNFFTIRVGNITEKKMEINDKNFFDYSKSKLISSAMDIYLIYKSKFFIGPESGLDKIANFFRKPIVLVNIQLRSVSRNNFLIPHEKKDSSIKISEEKLSNFTGEDIFFIPQKYLNLETNKYLTFSEMLTSEIGLYIFDDQFKKSKIKVVNNSQKEIMDAAEEMNLFLSGKLKFDAEDIKLQKDFWTLFSDEFSYYENYKISPSFLRNNLNLLQ